MTQTNQLATALLQWVEVTPTSTLSPFWYRTSRLLTIYDEPLEQNQLLAKLRTGQPVYNEPNALYLHLTPMNQAERKRLRHLLRLEVSGFKLETFRSTTAMFTRNEQHYHSMNELIERGHLPLPAIAFNPDNVCIKNANGHLLDVFVLVGQAKMNFTLNPTSPC